MDLEGPKQAEFIHVFGHWVPDQEHKPKEKRAHEDYWEQLNS